MAGAISVVLPKIFPLEFLIQTMSYLFLRLAHVRDICIGMLNLLTGRPRSSLLPRMLHKDRTGKTCLITGGNSGIGLSITKSMEEHGCKVYLTSRSMNKGRAAAEEAREHIMFLPRTVGQKHTRPSIEVKQLDNASFASVRHLLDELGNSGAKGARDPLPLPERWIPWCCAE